MNKQNEINELKIAAERALSAALFSMDYHVLQTIIDASKEATQACEQQDYQTAQYLINQAFWDIGIYIKKKLTHYTCVDANFFKSIAANIQTHLKKEQTVAFTAENLKRCFKLVELANKPWFKTVACQFSWSHFADALDKSNNFDELKGFLFIKPSLH